MSDIKDINLTGPLLLLLTVVIAASGLNGCVNDSTLSHCARKHDVYACKWVPVPVEQNFRDNPNKEGTN